MSLKARDLVTTPVSTVRPDTPLSEVIRSFTKDAAEGIPVVTEDQEVAGLLTEHEILKKITSNGNFQSMTAGDAMIRNPLIVDGEVSLSEIQNALVIGFRTGVLVTEGGKFSGMIEKSALLKLFCTDTDGSDTLAFVVDTTRALLSSKSRRQVLKILVERVGRYFNPKFPLEKT
jgi:CBS domain-containing protein